MSTSGNEDASFLDSLTSIDDILRQSYDRLSEISEEISNLDPRLIADNIEVYPQQHEVSKQLEMSTLVPAGDTAIKKREVPYDGWVDGYVVGFPDGTEQSVGLGLVDDKTGKRHFPSNPEDKYFAANGFTTEYNLTFEVDEGDVLATEFANNDPERPHFINSMVTIVKDDETADLNNGA